MPQKSRTNSNSKVKPKSDKSSLQSMVEKWVAPVILTLLLGAATWVFFTRLDRLEVTSTNLDHTVTQLDLIVKELDKNYSKDSEYKGTMQVDVNTLKTDVAVLKQQMIDLKSH
jgi:hypothetical protein